MIDNVTNALQSEISNFEKDVNSLATFIKNKPNINEIKIPNDLRNKDYAWALLTEKTNKPIAWNNHYKTVINTPKIEEIVSDSLGIYLVKKNEIIFSNKQYYLYGCLLIKNKNTNCFEGIDYIEELYDVSKTTTANKPIFNEQNQPILYLSKLQESVFIGYSTWAIVARILAVLILVFWVNYHARLYAAKKGFLKGFSILLLFILCFRAITYFFKFPFWFQKLPLFHPEVYASNSLHPSLGDLLVNSFLLFWLVSVFETKKNTQSFTINSKNFFINIKPLLAFVVTTFLFIDIIKSLIIDSKIPFEVSNFFSLNIYTLVALIIICLLFVNYIRISGILFKLIANNGLQLYKYLLVTISLSILFVFILKYNTKYGYNFSWLLVLWIAFFTTVLYVAEGRFLFKKYGSEIQSLFFTLFFTTSAAALTVFFEKKLDIEQRKILADKIYLELNNDEHFSLSHFKHDEHPYAVYIDGKLNEQGGNYFFKKNIQPPKSKFEIQQNYHTSKVVYKADEHTTIVLFKKDSLILNFITLFAYLFFTFLLVNSLVLLLIRIGSFHKLSYPFSMSSFFNIHGQIRITVIALSIIIFISIAITSIYFYIDKFNETHEDKIIKALNIGKQLEYAQIQNDSAFDATLAEIGSKSNFNINVYGADGFLIGNYDAVDKQVTQLQSIINYEAYQAIYDNHEIFYRKKVNASEKNVASYYMPLNNAKGDLIGSISIPDIDYKKDLKSDLSGFIATLININAFIFLLAVTLALIITNRITASFTLIKNKMKSINWSSKNEEIEWKRNDEIGALVAEYNVMVKKLEASANAFAATQKEVAWKEMAKQVAHEIKNPLTPMKLSIQYLQNKIDEDSPNIKQLSKTVAHTLIEQINQLSSIANDFFQFANIDSSHPQKMDLNEILNDLIELHKTNEKIVFENKLIDKPIFIVADKTQIIRLFTNIIKNAIEATENNAQSKIGMYQTISNNNIITAIQDNGTGITEELQSKIFSLHFTTKSSGTGLGLAICKSIVDNANGKIWFTSNENSTTFFIELALV